MTPLSRSICVLSAVVASFAAVSNAAEVARVRSRTVELRALPTEGARSKLKLGPNRDVAVLGKSEDGQWLKIRTEWERGEDVITLEGWVVATQLKSLSGDGFANAPALDSGIGAASAFDVAGFAGESTSGGGSGDPFGSSGAFETTSSTGFGEAESGSSAEDLFASPAPASADPWAVPSGDSASPSDAPAPAADPWASAGGGESDDDESATW